jgi:very-short-patch-repair endonuclease
MSPNRKIPLVRAKALRKAMTEVEKRLWYHLRAHRLLGMKFKRQKPIGPYIVDFACPALSLVIEVDGGQHSENAAYDRQRDIWLHKYGYTVLRFWNNEVMENMEGVLERIADAVRDQAPSPPSPLPQAGEGRKGALLFPRFRNPK